MDTCWEGWTSLYRGGVHTGFLHWARDGTQLVFDVGETVATVDIKGADARVIVDTDPENEWLLYPYSHTYGYHADVSPDGSRIVYASCEFPFPHEGYWYPAANELAIVNVDGTGRQRLTVSASFEGYPTWSPDGTLIAYIRTDDYTYDPFDSQIVIMAADGVTAIPNTKGVGLYPPVWSPDGERLAFTVNEAVEGDEYPHYPRHPYKRILYVVGVDGSELSRIGEATTLPTWSPDGERLAFGLDDHVYAVRSDGTDRRLIAEELQANQVSWSPDGTELLLASDDGVHVVREDGSEPRALGPANLRLKSAVWSLDGSTIAARHELRGPEYSDLWDWESSILIMARDGNDVRFLAEGFVDDYEPKLRASKPPSTDPKDCSSNTVIPNHVTNAGLVEDCATLLRMRNTFFGRAVSFWNADTPIASWPNVGVYGNPPRVQELWIWTPKPAGTVPPDIGKLTMLEVLHLSGHNLTGIPQGLAQLPMLRELHLRYNHLTGSTPLDVSKLTMLEELSVSGYYLSGMIPPEWGNLTNLKKLSISGTSLSGTIPPDLGRLTMLRQLDLSNNRLTGPIPAELSSLIYLNKLDLSGNDLSGCVPSVLRDSWVSWVEASGLERCKPEGEDGS